LRAEFGGPGDAPSRDVEPRQLGDQGSNLGLDVQSVSCCRYTIPQGGTKHRERRSSFSVRCLCERMFA
jgi:hypothetical protein